MKEERQEDGVTPRERDLTGSHTASSTPRDGRGPWARVAAKAAGICSSALTDTNTSWEFSELHLGQVGQGLEQNGRVEGVPAHRQRVGSGE